MNKKDKAKKVYNTILCFRIIFILLTTGMVYYLLFKQDIYIFCLFVGLHLLLTNGLFMNLWEALNDERINNE